MSKSLPIVLKHDDWPSSDRVAWDRLFEPGGLFDDAGPCRHWSEGSRKKRMQGYGQWLSFLLRTVPEAIGLDPSKRIDRPNVRRFIDECEARLKPRSTAGLVMDLCALASTFDPAADWVWLATAANRLQFRADCHSLPAPLPISAGDVFQWSLTRLVEVQDDDSLRSLQAAIRFRQALMIGFLISRPVRRRALLAMRVGHHVVAASNGFEICFDREDMKDGKARSFPLPRDLVEPMRAYLDDHRLVLLGSKTGDALWIGQYGNAITKDGLSRELPKVTERYLGVSMRPHAFRHVAATSIAEFDPEHVNIIMDILGHATLDMAEKHYNRAKGISSCTKLQSIMEDILEDVPRMGRAKRVLTPRPPVGDPE